MSQQLALLSLGLALAGCGAGGSTVPSPLAASKGPAAPAVLTFVSGETGQSVGGATVVVAGRSYTTDGAGRVLLERAAMGAPLRAMAAGFLERKTGLTSDRFTLWPKASPTGLDEDTTAHIVYNCPAASCAGGGEPLLRVLDRQVFVVPSAELQADPLVGESLVEAADRISAATHGEVSFMVTTAAPPSGVAVFLAVDPTDADVVSRSAAAVTKRSLGDRSNIVQATIVIRSVELARRLPLLLHELGHAFGLGHSPRVGDLMWAGPELYGVRDFSPRERLSVTLMLERFPGNRFPDDDEGIAALGSGGRRTSVIACGSF